MFTLFEILNNTSTEVTYTEEEIPLKYVKEDFPILYAKSKNGNIRYHKIEVVVGRKEATIISTKAAKVGAKEMEDIYTYTEGVNIGKSNETSFAEQAYFEARSMYNRLLDSGYTASQPKGAFNTDANGLIKPMLATSNTNKIVYPCLGQPKYDGVRCLCTLDKGEVSIRSRKGKIYSIPHLKKYLEENKHLLPLDGELYSHTMTFENIISAVKKESEETNAIQYIVYDIPVGGISNQDRWNKLEKDIEEVWQKKSTCPVVRSETIVVKKETDVDKWHDKFVKQGFEGMMLRNYTGEYSFGFRSSDLAKVKTFDDTEYKIVSVLEATGRDEGTAIFELQVGENFFRARPKGTKEVRTKYFKDGKKLIGKMCTVQYQGLSELGVPRFPVAVAIRDYE